MSTSRARDQQRAWLRRRSGGVLSTLGVLIGGASGAGKSTLAHLLAGKLGITTVVCTDTVREIVRQTTGAPPDSPLFRSTHRLSFREFETQCGMIYPALFAVLLRSRSTGEPIIVEGIHLVAPVMRRLSHGAFTVAVHVAPAEPVRRRQLLATYETLRPGQRLRLQTFEIDAAMTFGRRLEAAARLAGLPMIMDGTSRARLAATIRVVRDAIRRY